MITDIQIIRNELKDHEEVEMPYPFEKDTHIKYITKKQNVSSFYRGGKFHHLGNERIYLSNNGRMWSVPTCIKDKRGNIIYKSRFFIHKDAEDDIDLTSREIEMKRIIETQQAIIKKLSQQIIQLKKKKS